MPYVVNGHPEPRLYHYLQLQMLPLRRLILRLAGHELLFTLFHLSAEPFKLIPEYGLSIRHQFILFHTDVPLDALTQFGERGLELRIPWIECTQRRNEAFHLPVLL
jgi:hypothetical protein